MFQEMPSQAKEKVRDPDSPGSSGLWQRLELRLQVDGKSDLLWPKLEERLALAESHPLLRKDLVLKPIQPDNGQAYLLSDPVGGRYFRLGEREVFILSLLDGEHDVQEVISVCAARFGPIPAPAVERFLQDIRLAGLLEEGTSLWKRLGYGSKSGPLVLWTLPDAEEKLATLYSRLRFLFHPLAWGLVLGLLLGAIALLILNADLLRVDLAYLSSSWWLIPLLLLILYLAFVPIALTHEATHALACIHFGGRVSRLGLMIRHLLPAAFADVSDVWTLTKGARQAVFLAGPASTVVWAALATGLWAWTPATSLFHLIGAGLMLATFLSTLTGLNPVGGYDGTEVLSEWLEVPDLHLRALHYGRDRLRGRPLPEVSPRKRRIFYAYGLTFLLYNVAMLAVIAVILWQWLLR